MQDSTKEAARPRRAIILEAATTLFADKGFDGASTRDLSRMVGINIATLYHYFPDKQSIYDEVTTQAHVFISHRLAGAASGSDAARTRLRRFIATLVHVYTQETPEARLIDRQQIENSFASALSRPNREYIWPTHQAVLSLVEDLFAGTLTEEMIDEEARLLISMVYGATKLQPVHRNIRDSDPYAARPLEDALFVYYDAHVTARRAALEG